MYGLSALKSAFGLTFSGERRKSLGRRLQHPGVGSGITLQAGTQLCTHAARGVCKVSHLSSELGSQGATFPDGLSRCPQSRGCSFIGQFGKKGGTVYCEIDSCGGRQVSNLRDHCVKAHSPPGRYHWSCVHLDNVLGELSCALGVPGRREGAGIRTTTPYGVSSPRPSLLENV